MGLANFLEQILKAKQARLPHLHTRSLEELRAEALAARHSAPRHVLLAAIARLDRLNIIAEIKRGSPSQGVIRAELNPAELALEYSKGGAAAISVLTEEDLFRGSLDDLRAVRAVVSLPVLRKDLITESRQVYETAIAGADALLLIMAAMDDERFALLQHIAEEELGLDVLVEVHSASEMRRAHILGATLIVVNNHHTYTHEASLENSVEVARAAPKEALLVSEGDFYRGRHIHGLRALGYKGFLIGESLLREKHPDEALRDLLHSARSYQQELL
jgi:indole-3-glycerol phosphate synthase